MVRREALCEHIALRHEAYGPCSVQGEALVESGGNRFSLHLYIRPVSVGRPWPLCWLSLLYIFDSQNVGLGRGVIYFYWIWCVLLGGGC